LQHVPFEGLGSIGAWLRTSGAEVTATRFHEEASLPDVRTLDLVIAMGGAMSVNDEPRLPWLAAERQFVAAAIDRGVAVLGICLGAQLIARASGARVYPNAEREVGWWPITGTSETADVPDWARKGAINTVFHWHGETFDLPRGAVRLARSEGCEQQAFQIGRHVIGIQFHLETTPDLVDGLIENGPEDLAPSRFVQTAEELRSASARRCAAANQLMVDTLEYLCGMRAAQRVDGTFRG
jgi:GMP synthase-like glutamine amidotransferase